MKRIFVASTMVFLVGCSGLTTAPESTEASSQATTQNEPRERGELENLLLTLDHVNCNIDMFDYEEGRTKIRCK